MFEYEVQKLKDGFEFVVGVDEVGRGAIAGPVVSAAVMFNVNHITAADGWIHSVKDSKTLSARKREEISEKILAAAEGVELAQVEAKEIDEMNIHVATLHAMKKAVETVSLQKNLGKVFVSVDGRFVPNGMLHNCEAVVGGDAKVFSISAASIVAKVFRDKLMMEHGKRFSDYGWEKNKGYGTADHIAAVKKYGLTPMHRVTFCKNFV